MRIVIKTNSVRMQAELNDSETSRAIWDALPIESEVSLWGEEIYFKIPVQKNLENGIEVVNEGDLCYWPEGKAFCLFFGKTPISNDEIRPYSAVTFLGRLLGNPREWKSVEQGEKITIEHENS